MRNTKYIFLLSWLCMIAMYGYSQSSSQWMESVSIDGKLEEWNAVSFRYDQGTDLWYTLGNDDLYLYLAVRKNKNHGKIFKWGGLLFTVNMDGKKTIDRSPGVAFPLAVKNDKRVPDDELTTIAVAGFHGISESELNIYNEHGIQVGWTLEIPEEEGEEPTYLYELAIPLALLQAQPESELDFSILLRGFRKLRPGPRDNPMLTTREVLMNHPYVRENRVNLAEIDKAVEYAQDNNSWTEFWGTYRLASNPRQ